MDKYCQSVAYSKKGAKHMTITIDAIYSNGVFKPLTPLHLTEQQHVTLRVSVPSQRPSASRAEVSALADRGTAALDELMVEAITVLRAQTKRKGEELVIATLPPPEAITLKGLWSQIDANAVEAALAEVRTQTNHRLERLLDEI